MTNIPASGTRDVPLRFAAIVSKLANKAWEDGSLLERATPVTQDLLRFWFQESFCTARQINFHEGQKQAILNAVYLHEVLKTKNIFDAYMNVNSELLQEMDLLDLKQSKHDHPKYAVKMATGTGKTWVLNSLLVWQFLNAKFEQTPSGRYSKNFLLVAPGLIVYERLLDAFLGKENEEGQRDFDKSDFKKVEELFLPPQYREMFFGFVQYCVATKEEIGSKVTGEGIIAITNWHTLAMDEAEAPESSPLEDPSRVVKDLLPITPGTSQGHALEQLDRNYLGGVELQYLKGLLDLVVFNDEAHHIHEIKKAGEVFEVEWQKSLAAIAESKPERFIQIDFSATPYNQAGSGQNRVKHYFPHVIVDFDLKTAIQQGLVKIIALDRRSEIAALPLEFKAERQSGAIVLSEGQKVMLRAGLNRLKVLEKSFVDATKDKQGVSQKHPKMLVICEDTRVSPHVVDFLTRNEGLAEEDVVQIDSDKKGQIPQAEWQTIKQKLFNIDQHATPKVIVSVLMLREGFDVNNICVIVPLRSSQAPILLEQIIGRGLRLMWREPEYREIKQENRVRLLQKKEEPKGYYDILHIVEHPAFIQFYEELLKANLAGELDEMPTDKDSILGDIIAVPLKEGFEKYDLYWPLIVRESEETLVTPEPTTEGLEKYPVSLEELRKIAPTGGDRFFAEEITVKTRFGEYTVTSALFNAKSYNEFIARLVGTVTSVVVPVGRKSKAYPAMQINSSQVAAMIDRYIRQDLFGEDFDPLAENNWRILLLSESRIIKFIVTQVSRKVHEMQTNVNVEEATILKRHFSEVAELKMRRNFSIEVAKSIYARLPFPSNKGSFERDFIIFADRQQAEAFIKINDNYHEFAHVNYIREDGILARYFPDFLVKTAKTVYVVETKAQENLSQGNVIQKRKATVDFVERINKLKPEDRMNRQWVYSLVGEKTFYSFTDKGASLEQLLDYCKQTKDKIDGKLAAFDIE